MNALVALVHATPASMGPARDAFAEAYPQATLWNLLDDRLIGQAEAAGGVTVALRDRMASLIRYAIDGGADAVLLSCSMYGPVAHEIAATATVPVLASDQALFDAVAGTDARRIAVLGPVPTGVEDTVARLKQRLADDRAIDGAVVEGAREATTAGDPQALERTVSAAARSAARTSDLVVLGQFSISPALRAARAVSGVPVLSPPHLAAEAIRSALAGAHP